MPIFINYMFYTIVLSVIMWKTHSHSFVPIICISYLRHQKFIFTASKKSLSIVTKTKIYFYPFSSIIEKSLPDPSTAWQLCKSIPYIWIPVWIIHFSLHPYTLDLHSQTWSLKRHRTFYKYIINTNIEVLPLL